MDLNDIHGPKLPVVNRPYYGCMHLSYYLLVVNNNKYLSYVVDNIIFGISVPDYLSRTVESNSLRIFCNLLYSVYFIFI